MSKLFADLLEKRSPPPVSNQAQDAAPSAAVPTETLAVRSSLANDPIESIPPRNNAVKRHQDSMVARHREAMVSRYHATMIPPGQAAMVDTIRKAVRQHGKEAATYRFTPEEKEALGDVIYSYKARGIKTSECELTRIAIHSLIEEYREVGEASILAQVLERLND